MKSWWTSQRKLGRNMRRARANAGPEPGAEEVAARGSEDEAEEDSGDVKDDGVFGEKAEADDGTDGDPPAGIFSAEEADDEAGDEHPPEEIEGRVLEFSSAEERQR